MGTRTPADANHIPTGHPEPACNTGYAEPKPRNKGEAQIPGAEPPPDPEAGGLGHDPDPAP
ncbi:MAG: hypothetical protein J0M21_06880 [Xanthomonadales bacterium]|nr:hypothetical protein [Xanthomonadales bacterium]